jgi:membrane dipeptidase
MERSGISRRGFVAGALVGGVLVGGSGWARALAAVGKDDLDPKVKRALERTIGIDMHEHVYPAGTEPHPHFGPPPHPPEEQAGATLDLATEVRRSGLTAVCASFVLDFAKNDKPGDAMTNYMQWMKALDGQLAVGKMHAALKLSDLLDAHRTGRPTIVKSVEGAMFLEGNLKYIDVVYQRGVRHLQLLHMKDDLVSPLGEVITGESHVKGLSAFGAEVIQECNRVGMLVDLAHAAPETVRAALKVSKKPVIYSHTGWASRPGKDPRVAKMMAQHLMSDERAKVIADAGGVVGVWTKQTDSPKEFVERLHVAVEAIGVEHVGIGTDEDLLSSRAGQGLNLNWPGMKAGFFTLVVEEMVRQGWSLEETEKVGGGNYCRVFGAATVI